MNTAKQVTSNGGVWGFWFGFGRGEGVLSAGDICTSMLHAMYCLFVVH